MNQKSRLSKLEGVADERFFDPQQFFERQSRLPRAEADQRLRALSDGRLDELCAFAYQDWPELRTMSDEELEARCSSSL